MFGGVVEHVLAASVVFLDVVIIVKVLSAIWDRLQELFREPNALVAHVLVLFKIVQCLSLVQSFRQVGVTAVFSYLVFSVFFGYGTFLLT